MASSRLGALLGDAPLAPEEQSLARLRVSIKAALRHGASQTTVANVCRSELAFANQMAPPSDLANPLGRMLRNKPVTVRAGNLEKMEWLVAKSKALGLGGRQRPASELARRKQAEQIIKQGRQLLKKQGAAAPSSGNRHEVESNFARQSLLAAGKAEREALLENQPWSPSAVLHKKPAATNRSR